MAADADAPVDVAVGVVIRADGAVLLGQRPPGKPYAGWWEFPGGKLEPGETVEQALARELHEELGIDVRACCPWVVREFVYPHARVRLHFRRVFAFDGEPHSREGQAFVWQAPHAVTVAPLLPATVPVIGWLRLPPLAAESAAAALGEDAFLAALAATKDAGLLLLDEPALAGPRFEALFHRLMPLCRAAGTKVLVASHHPASFANAADGVCLTTSALSVAGERPNARLAGAWCANAADVRRAGRLGLDFAIVDWPAADVIAMGPRLPVFGRPAHRPGEPGGADGPDWTARTRALVAAQRAGAHGLVLRGQWWGAGSGAAL